MLVYSMIVFIFSLIGIILGALGVAVSGGGAIAVLGFMGSFVLLVASTVTILDIGLENFHTKRIERMDE
jgi:hypothetical protein